MLIRARLEMIWGIIILTGLLITFIFGLQSIFTSLIWLVLIVLGVKLTKKDSDKLNVTHKRRTTMIIICMVIIAFILTIHWITILDEYSLPRLLYWSSVTAAWMLITGMILVITSFYEEEEEEYWPIGITLIIAGALTPYLFATYSFHAFIIILGAGFAITGWKRKKHFIKKI